MGNNLNFEQEYVEMDDYDAGIINALRADGRLSWTSLARQINLSASACQRRVESLLERGVIEKFTVHLDDAARGFAVRAFVSVNIDRQHNELATDFVEAVLAHPNVQNAHMLSGNIDFMLEVVAEDLSAFGEFINGELLAMPAVKDASSSIVLDVVKRT